VVASRSQGDEAIWQTKRSDRGDPRGGCAHRGDPAGRCAGEHHKKPKHVRAVIVKVVEKGSIEYRFDNSYLMLNGQCGSGDPSEDTDPVTDRDYIRLAWKTTIAKLRIQPGEPTQGIATPKASDSQYDDLGHAYEDTNNPGDCRSQSSKVPWHCQGALRPQKNSSFVATTGAREARGVKFVVDFGGFYAHRALPFGCGSGSAYEPVSVGQYFDRRRRATLVLDLNGSGPGDQTFHLTDAQFHQLASGVAEGGDAPTPEFLSNCSVANDPVSISDDCSQTFTAHARLELHPVKVIW
jgi:hypothetical protein